jgi:hypothetical protein
VTDYLRTLNSKIRNCTQLLRGGGRRTNYGQTFSYDIAHVWDELSKKKGVTFDAFSRYVARFDRPTQNRNYVQLLHKRERFKCRDQTFRARGTCHLDGAITCLCELSKKKKW